MIKKKKRKKIIRKLRNRYRLSILNDTTFQEVWSMNLTRLKVLTITVLSGLFLIVITTLLIAYTPLREYIPGYPSGKMRKMIVRNAILVDSLAHEIRIRDNYFDKIKSLMSGEVPSEGIAGTASPEEVSDIQLNQYDHDSIFQEKLLAEQLNLAVTENEQEITSMSQLHFFVPLKGIITHKFKASTEHFGIDIVGEPNARISATLEGTIIFSGWTPDAGHVIYIQHQNDLISAYKHNSELLKETGDVVKAGEAIAIMGNSGELSTGPHLHFELWRKGVPLDAEAYIDF